VLTFEVLNDWEYLIEVREHCGSGLGERELVDLDIPGLSGWFGFGWFWVGRGGRAGGFVLGT